MTRHDPHGPDHGAHWRNEMLAPDPQSFPQTQQHEAGMTPWQVALLSAALFAVDPLGLGGVAVCAHAGPVRDRWQAYLDALFPAGTPRRRAPANIADDRLIGGLDIAATLRAGRPVADRGLLAECDGGVVLLAMAERLPLGTAARIAGAMDRGAVELQRDGLSITMPARFGVVAFDESLGEDEAPPSALRDRLAFALDLREVAWGEAAREAGACEPAQIAEARARLPGVNISEEIVKRLCAVTLALGIASARAPGFAMRAARAAAALDGRDEVKEDDAILAARLTLAHRAQQAPAPPEAAETADDPTPEPPQPDDGDENREAADAPTPEDILLAAARAAIPDGLLDRLRIETLRGAQGAAGHAGALVAGKGRGRPVGVRAQAPRSGARLSVVETLRAAAPWQPLRRATANAPAQDSRSIVIRPEDFRTIRFKQRSETLTIFVVDASGSTALTRLAEAKGAVELLLADCYVRRDQVALIGFRRQGAELLLPPTRSLTRAKRSLAGLPGGGGTPLGAGLREGLTLARAARRRGQTPILVVLTDGRANVGLDGTGGRQRAAEDARNVARAIRSDGVSSIVIDTSPRAQQPARMLAETLAARYLPLPFANAASLSQAVRAVQS